ncbi:uncharacterized protein tedc2 isoform X2 [Echeneis naucrates]|uniref:uncharacterized protein tedc2 isoform X2 n=1 Tax=Echeneis naucrates TaxID=173247 RepID=UPI0011133F3A|nr:uncharacterized protein LOC115047733 isoform X2 [Echeneis naucrates]
MSLLAGLEQAIRSCKAEQQKISDSIRDCREILQTMPQPQMDSEESECADAACTDTSTSQGEREDIELLEQALEKALWVRTGSQTSRKDPDRNKKSGLRKETGTFDITSKDASQPSAPSKGNQVTNRSTCNSANINRKEHKKTESSVSSSLRSRPSAVNNPGKSKTIKLNYRGKIQKHPVLSAGSVYHRSARKLQQAGSSSGTHDHPKKECKSSVLTGDDLGKAATIPIPSSNVPFSHAKESEAHTSLQHTGTTLEQTTKWNSLRSKQNRLWDKVMAIQRKPVPGRSHFMEKMKATFPMDWPSGSPAQTKALVDRLTEQGRDLTQHCQTMERLAKLTPETTAGQGDKKNKYDSYPTLERLQMTAAQLQRYADQTKQEWEAWDRWRPDGGCLCPSGTSNMWVDGMVAPLPRTITYTTEAELCELERLRMQVALLQQEINLEQTLLDTLSPQLLSITSGPERPNPSVLRDVYSLLGEGGERFPSIVLDSEPE